MKNLKILAITVLIISIVSSCRKDEDSGNDFPSTPEEIEKAVENSKYIADNAETIIEEAISDALLNDELVNSDDIAKLIKNITGVRSATATSTGTGVVVEQTDGTFTNILIVDQGDERFFIKENKKSSLENMSALLVDENPVMPNGNGKALILAPFQYQLKTNLSKISALFEAAGYDVDRYDDSNATLARFTGSFLNNYDIVFIYTHSGAYCKTLGGIVSTILLTGEEYSDVALTALSNEEQRAVATGSHDSKTYFALSVPWVEKTVDSDFPDSWFFASGCETALINAGPSSLSEALLNLGVVGYNGYDAVICDRIAGPIAEKMVSRFTAGLEFVDASKEVLNDLGLKATAWALRIIAKKETDPEIRVELFDYDKTINDPFYLIDPDSVVGVAEVIPSSGPVGTDVIYQVTVNERFVSRVTNIEFDIDNTGEHLGMVKVSSNVWKRDGLRAPTAQSYPRIDTFTFTAYDSDGNTLGQGSATFSILENPSKKSENPVKHYYYDYAQ